MPDEATRRAVDITVNALQSAIILANFLQRSLVASADDATKLEAALIRASLALESLRKGGA